MKIAHIKIMLFLLFVLDPGSAYADFVATLSVDISSQADKSYLYQYTLTVSPVSTLPSDGLDIFVDPAANIQPLGSLPFGWDVFYNPGDPVIGWGAEQFSPFLSPGSSTVFSFTSPLKPVNQAYVLFGLDDAGQVDGTISGQILAPGFAVPEPTSMIPLGIGIATLAGYNVYRSRKTSY